MYIFTKSQIEKINEEISEDLADYLQKKEDIITILETIQD